MAYRGGGDRGDQRPPYGHGGAGGGGGGRPFVWPPPPSTPRPVTPPAPYGVPMGYRAPMAVPHQGAYGVPMAVYRPSAQAPAYRVPAPTAGPPVSFSPAPPAATVTIRAPPSSSSSTTSPAAAPSSSTPAPPPRQPAPQTASTPASETAPSSASSAPSTAALAKEVEKELFVSETALAPQQGTAAAGAVDDASDVDLAPVSKKGLAHPARPGLATVGKKVMIRANHFLVNVADNNLFHYDVAINPESKSRATNREVLNELIKLHGKTALGGKLPAYDGRKSLYTAGSLPFESEEFVVTLVDPEKKEKERAEREYKITIRIAGRTDLYHLQQFLRGRQRDMPQETIQVLDVVLRESPSWNYVTVCRSFFSTTFGHRGDIGEGLECWRGYYQSLRPTQMGLSLNIDISATSFFKPVTVIKFVEEFLNLRDTSRPLSDTDRVKIKKALCGVRIETTHQQDQIRRYKITGVTPIPMSQLIFPVDDKGTRKTVVQYFWSKYNYRLKYGSWPCLQAGSDSRPVYLPMEVCKILEGQRYSKKLNDRQVTNILRATCKRPQEREQSICDMVLHNKYADDNFAQEVGIQVSSDLVTVPARVLPPPLLKYHDSGREKTCAPSVGQWNMFNKKLINGGTIDNWTCLNFSRMRPEEVQRFCMDLTHMCNATGMVVNPRPFVEVRSAAPNHIENALRDVHRRATQMLAQQGVGNQLQLLIVILPEVSGSYGKIKRVCETDIGIVSQCCLPKHASRPNKQYLENVELKINVKVGGRNTVLERAFVHNGIPFVSEVPTIIFGADVTPPWWHQWTGQKSPSTEVWLDLFTVSKYPQKGHNVNGGMIRELLIAFRKKTNRRPERIIFYRDGVSEGQFSHVLLHEMDAIRKACASLEEGYLPPVTFVVVQKRHHTRLFPEVHGRRDMTDKSGNILPGTVVDQKICHPTECDFYLCSHAGIQGTSRPTHYHVLYDENHFTADALQSLTNNLCYTYARCTRAVSVVPPAYYAHLAAFRARYYVEGESSDGGSTPGSSGQTVAFVRNGIPFVSEVPTIIFPADVTHTPPGEDSGSSIAAVASMDCPEITKSKGLISAQGSHAANYQNCSESINITVFLLERQVEISVSRFSTLGYTVRKAMDKIGVHLNDIYFLCDGNVIEPTTALYKSCILRSRHRLRGGQRNAPIPFKVVIKRERQNGNFFERIDLSADLQMLPPYDITHVIGLGDYARHLYKMLTKAFEDYHDLGYTFKGNVSLDDIWYIPDTGTVQIRRESEKALNQANYILDVNVILTVIELCFRYTDSGIDFYPMHLRHLKKWITRLQCTGTEYESKIKRATVYLNPVGWSAADRIKLFTGLMIHFHKLPRNDKRAFRHALGAFYSSLKWKKYMTSTEMKRCESSAPNKKQYFNTFLGRLDFSRCFVTHVEAITGSEKQADAAVYLLGPRQITDLLDRLLLNYKPPTVASIPAVAASNAPAIPAVAAANAPAIPAVAAANAPAIPAVVAANVPAVPAVAATNVPDIPAVYVTNIQSVNTLEVYHYFGFTYKPSS